VNGIATRVANLTFPLRTVLTTVGGVVERLVKPESDALGRPTVASITTYSTRRDASSQADPSEDRTAR
jgi:hypothetical protein